MITQGFPQVHNIQVVLASRRGRGWPSISLVGMAVLLSAVTFNSLPSGLSGPEGFSMSRNLALTAHTQEVLMRSA